MTNAWAYPTDPSLSLIAPGSTTVSYSETYNQTDIENATSLDFTAVKSGDVRVLDPDYDKSVTEKLDLLVTDYAMTAGQTLQIPIYREGLTVPTLMSLSLAANGPISFEGISSATLTVSDGDFVQGEDGNTLKMIWFQHGNNFASLSSEEPLFYLTVKALEDLSSVREAITLVHDDQVGNFFATNEAKKGQGPLIRGITFNWDNEDANLPVGTVKVALRSANPFREKILLRVDAPSESGGTFRLFDLNGRMINQQSVILNQGQTDLDLSFMSTNAPPGVYLLSLRVGEDQRTIRLVKQ